MPNWFKTDKPLEDGWYWHRYDEKIPTSCVLVKENQIWFAGFEQAETNFSGSWSGPIEPPFFDGEE